MQAQRGSPSAGARAQATDAGGQTVHLAGTTAARPSRSPLLPRPPARPIHSREACSGPQPAGSRAPSLSVLPPQSLFPCEDTPPLQRTSQLAGRGDKSFVPPDNPEQLSSTEHLPGSSWVTLSCDHPSLTWAHFSGHTYSVLLSGYHVGGAMLGEAHASLEGRLGVCWVITRCS